MQKNPNNLRIPQIINPNHKGSERRQSSSPKINFMYNYSPPKHNNLQPIVRPSSHHQPIVHPPAQHQAIVHPPTHQTITEVNYVW